MNRLFLPIVLLSVLAGCAFVRGILGMEPPSGVPPGTVRLLGAHGKAAGMALADVLGKLDAEYTAAKQTPGYTSDPVIECFLRPEAYDVYVGFQDDKYLVRVVSVDERCIEPPAQFVHGGGIYEIDAKSFTIVRRAVGEESLHSVSGPAPPPEMAARPGRWGNPPRARRTRACQRPLRSRPDSSRQA